MQQLDKMQKSSLKITEKTLQLVFQDIIDILYLIEDLAIKSY